MDFFGEKYCAHFCALFGWILCAFEFRIIEHSDKSEKLNLWNLEEVDFFQVFSQSEVKFWSYSSAGGKCISLISALFSKRNSIFFQNTLRLKDEKLQLSRSLISPSCSLCSVEFLFRSLSIPKCQSGSYKTKARGWDPNKSVSNVEPIFQEETIRTFP